MEGISKSSFHLYDQRIDPARCVILTAEGEIHIEPRVMEVLLLMVERAGQVVIRDEFINTVWSGTYVSDEVLSRCIYRLRQTLGDNPKKPRFIETVPKRGYRLIAPVRKNTTVGEILPSTSDMSLESRSGQRLIPLPVRQGLTRRKYLYWIVPTVTICILVAMYLFHIAHISQPEHNFHERADGADDAASTYSPASETMNSIAVLPFVNMSDNPENDYFCDGISEELIGLLAKVPSLKVVARTSSFVFKDKGADVRRIAEQLGVKNILEGSVQLDGGRIRISAHLVDASTGYQLWAETFDTEFEDIFSIQEQVAGAIVSALKVSLDAEDGVPGITDRAAPTADMTAYKLYLQGLYHWKRRGESSIRKSIELFKAAIERDPAFAHPYLALSAAYLVLPYYSRESPAKAFVLAEAAARKALNIDPTLGKANAVLAFISLKRWDWSTAERQFRLAFAAAPNDPTTHQWYSQFLSYLGYINDSVKAALRAQELDPVSPVINDRLGITYLWSGDYERAAQQFHVATELGLDRKAYDQAYVLLLLRTGQIDAAISLYEKILGKLGLNTNWIHLVAKATGDSALVPEALEAVARAREQGPLPDAMVFYAAVLLKQPDLAFDILDNMVRDKSLTVEFLFSPEAKELRGDPRFPQLLAAIGIDEYWDQHGWPPLCNLQDGIVVCN